MKCRIAFGKKHQNKENQTENKTYHLAKIRIFFEFRVVISNEVRNLHSIGFLDYVSLRST
jgi:thiamine pyrophosphokinase